MDYVAFREIAETCRDAGVQERTIAYLTEHLGNFLRKRERVLICFMEHSEGSRSWLMEQAVLGCEAIPIVIGPDRRWKTILRLAFTNKVSAIIGEPLLILGLTKLKKYSATPLSVRRVVTAGYPCPDWMIDGIVKGFDCQAGGCFGLQQSSVVAGFACGQSWGVHIRDEEYGVEILDEEGNPLPPGEMGEILIYPKRLPHLRYALGDHARLVTQPCKCGSKAPRLIEMNAGSNSPADLDALGQQLQSWTSILDCRLRKTECGLEVEIVCFQGEKLPKLPTLAKLVVRPWQPDVDEPFYYRPDRMILDNLTENH